MVSRKSREHRCGLSGYQWGSSWPIMHHWRQERPHHAEPAVMQHCVDRASYHYHLIIIQVVLWRLFRLFRSGQSSSRHGGSRTRPGKIIWTIDPRAILILRANMILRHTIIGFKIQTFFNFKSYTLRNLCNFLKLIYSLFLSPDCRRKEICQPVCLKSS